MTIHDPDAYFERGCGRCERFGTADCSARLWRGGLLALRGICRGEGMAETAKWGQPCYVHSGRNVAILGAFQGDFRLSFFDAALLTDPDGILERQGPNTRHPDVIRFTDPSQVAQREPTIRAYLREAMGHAEAGTKPPRDDAEPELPDELTEALDADPALAEAFQALTPGRRRSYVIALNGAKRRETRVARIERFRGRILEGKGATER